MNLPYIHLTGDSVVLVCGVPDAYVYVLSLPGLERLCGATDLPLCHTSWSCDRLPSHRAEDPGGHGSI